MNKKPKNKRLTNKQIINKVVFDGFGSPLKEAVFCGIVRSELKAYSEMELSEIEKAFGGFFHAPSVKECIKNMYEEIEAFYKETANKS
jgi:hypothetical protein